MKYSPTWIYKNRVTKHFVIVLDFPCLSLFTMLFAYVVHFGCFVVRDLCSSGCRGNFANYRSLQPLLPLPPANFICLTRRQLFEISARLKLLSVPFSSLYFVIGHLEKRFQERIM